MAVVVVQMRLAGDTLRGEVDIGHTSSSTSVEACIGQGDSCPEGGSPACCPGTSCTGVSFGYGFCALDEASSSAGPSCGDGNIDPGEECESMNLNGETCTSFGFDGGSLNCVECFFDTSDCTYNSSASSAASCGNNLTEPGETCDEGGVDTNGCDFDCSIRICGDGYQNSMAEEECDDGGTANGDGCNASCQVEECGNNVTDANEDCDDGAIDTMTCNFDCSTATCGDGYTNTMAEEECDDANGVAGDGCFECAVEECGNNVKDAGEECDGIEFDGLQCTDFGYESGELGCDELCGVDTSTCVEASSSSSSSSSQSSTACGNSIVEGEEQCDGGLCCTNTCTYVTNGTSCRAAAGLCDVAETCSGDSATCPADAYANSGTSCRAATNECDLAETCTGSATACPTDIYKSNGTSCNSGAGSCVDNICVAHSSSSSSSSTTTTSSSSTATSAAEESSDASEEEELCGNNTIDPGEECDGFAFNDTADECSELGFDDGNLSCSEECTLDVSECEINCGNGQLDPGEQCDASAPAGPNNQAGQCNAQCNVVPGIGNGGGNAGNDGGQCPASCDDNDPCTSDSCNVNTFECVHANNGACTESSASSSNSSSSSSSSGCPEGEVMTTFSTQLVPVKPNKPITVQGEKFDEANKSIEVKKGDTVEIKGYAYNATFKRHFTDDRVVFKTKFGSQTVDYFVADCSTSMREVGDEAIDATSMFIDGDNVTKDINMKFFDVCGQGEQHQDYYAWVTGCREDKGDGSADECEDEKEVVVKGTDDKGVEFKNDGEAGNFKATIVSKPGLPDSGYMDRAWFNGPDIDIHRAHGGSVIVTQKNQKPLFAPAVSPDEPNNPPMLRVVNQQYFFSKDVTPWIDPPYDNNRKRAADAARGASYTFQLGADENVYFIVNETKNPPGYADNMGEVHLQICRVKESEPPKGPGGSSASFNFINNPSSSNSAGSNGSSSSTPPSCQLVDAFATAKVHFDTVQTYAQGANLDDIVNLGDKTIRQSDEYFNINNPDGTPIFDDDLTDQDLPGLITVRSLRQLKLAQHGGLPGVGNSEIMYGTITLSGAVFTGLANNPTSPLDFQDDLSYGRFLDSNNLYNHNDEVFTNVAPNKVSFFLGVGSDSDIFTLGFLPQQVCSANNSSSSSSSSSQALCDPAAGTTNLLANGDFEQPTIVNPKTNNLWAVYGGASNPQFYDPQPSIPGWNAKSPYQVELQRLGLYGTPAKGLQYAEIDVPGEVDLTQNIATQAGATYEIRFAYAANPQIKKLQKLGLNWGGNQIAEVSATPSGSGIQWTCKSFQVTANGTSTPIGFGSIEDSGAGNFIDNVSVIKISNSATSGASNSSVNPVPPPGPGGSSANSGNSSNPGQCRGDECGRGGDAACAAQSKVCRPISNLPCIQCIAASSSSVASAAASSSSRASVAGLSSAASQNASANQSQSAAAASLSAAAASLSAAAASASNAAASASNAAASASDAAASVSAAAAASDAAASASAAAAITTQNPFNNFQPGRPVPPPSQLCGNNTVNRGEECDDGNQRDLDGCSAYCLREGGFCGDGIVQSLLGERCERSVPGILPCNDVCRFELTSCGDGVVNLGEDCDDGAMNSISAGARCRLDCSLARCGDLILDPDEECDDGNRLAGDTCDAFCRIERKAAPGTLPAQLVELPVFTECTSARQCASGVCRDNRCQLCRSDRECGDNGRCLNGMCQRAVASVCYADADCGSGRCANSRCVQCVMHSDCPGTQQCVGNRCVVAPATAGQNAQTGPETAIVITAGAAAGWAWVRRRRM